MATKATRRSKGDGMIRQRADGSWEGRLPVGKNRETGKTEFKSFYGKTMKVVRDKIKEYTDNPPVIVTSSGTYKKIEDSTGKSLLFKEWIDTWLKQYKANTLTPATYESYRIVIEQHLKPAFGSTPISEITTDQIQKLLNTKLEDGARMDGRDGKLATSSVIKMKIIMNASMKQAVRNRYIPFNPTEAVEAPKMIRKEIRVLTVAEQDIFMKTLKGHRLEALFKLALATGMRKGELLGLTWDCIDFENNTISISKSANRVRNQETMKTVIAVGGPKSASGYREIPMLPAVAPILNKHLILQEKEKREAGSAYNMENLVFCSNVGTYIEPTRINTTLGKLIKKAGIEHINFHALRHTFATRALENGIPAKVVQAMLGHADIALTLNTYTHLLKDTLHEQMQKMNNVFLEKPVKPETKSNEKVSSDWDREPVRER